ncbi:MAG: hypothetical protein ACRCX2_01140 [Paraclostridium sp.]
MTNENDTGNNTIINGNNTNNQSNGIDISNISNDINSSDSNRINDESSLQKTEFVTKEELGTLTSKMDSVLEVINKIIVQKPQRNVGNKMTDSPIEKSSELDKRLAELEKIQDEISLSTYTDKINRVFKSETNKKDVLEKIKFSSLKEREKIFNDAMEKEKNILIELSKLSGAEEIMFNNRYLSDPSSDKERLQKMVDSCIPRYAPSGLDLAHGITEEYIKNKN